MLIQFLALCKQKQGWGKFCKLMNISKKISWFHQLFPNKAKTALQNEFWLLLANGARSNLSLKPFCPLTRRNTSLWWKNQMPTNASHELITVAKILISLMIFSLGSNFWIALYSSTDSFQKDWALRFSLIANGNWYVDINIILEIVLQNLLTE